MEYKILEVKYGEAEKKMNEMAKEGWRVAGTTLFEYSGFTRAGTLMVITFERENH